MAGFSVVSEPIRTRWYPVDYATTLYVGQIVTWCFQDAGTKSSGLQAYAGTGLAGTTTDHCPLGVVIGFNNRTPLFDTTYKSHYATGVQTTTAQLARESVTVEGQMWKNDPALMANVALIDHTTRLKGRIFHGSYGTAPDVCTSTAADSTGVTLTTSAIDQTTVAYNNMFYCRTGKNMGLYRMAYSASTTSHTFYLRWPYGIAIGDTFVPVFFGLGTQKVNFDDIGTYIVSDGDTNSYGTDYIWLDIEELNLREAGNEYAIFKFNQHQLSPTSK